jgi:hypothetical protein
VAEYVRKLRVAAIVSQAGEPPLEGFFALAPRAEFHEGPETLLERLNSPDRVIPFERDSDDVVVLFNRLEIEWVQPGPNVNPELLSPRTFRVTREERVQVRFGGGEALDGLLRMELPEYLNRASDFLNGPEHFFPLVTERGVILINKLAILNTRLYESSPRPVPDGE